MSRLRTLPPRLKPAAQTRVRRLPTEGGAHRAHYQSAAHRAWARRVKERAGMACQSCGAHGPGVRLVADHIREARDGGELLALANGQCLCAACHAAKTAKARGDRLKG